MKRFGEPISQLDGHQRIESEVNQTTLGLDALGRIKPQKRRNLGPHQCYEVFMSVCRGLLQPCSDVSIALVSRNWLLRLADYGCPRSYSLPAIRRPIRRPICALIDAGINGPIQCGR